ncbi:MAG: EutN/CcmL family microcompartment protein [Clostridiaceae bacterium]|nr:EutN/CcmL family microcompartment protein [Clostridiaceae bacterium]
MQIAKVVGNVVSTVKLKQLYGHKLMLVQYLDLDGQAVGKEQIVIDAVDSGIGDTVLVNQDGGAGLIILRDKEAVVDFTICGIIDRIDVD